MSETTESTELDFNADDYNSFYYTMEKQIKRIDDEFILSKIAEKYPDLKKSNDENTLKQVILVILNDGRILNEIEDKYQLLPTETIKMIYRNYDFIFNKCYITKIQKTIKNKSYAKRATKRCRIGERKTNRGSQG